MSNTERDAQIANANQRVRELERELARAVAHAEDLAPVDPNTWPPFDAVEDLIEHAVHIGVNEAHVQQLTDYVVGFYATADPVEDWQLIEHNRNTGERWTSLHATEAAAVEYNENQEDAHDWSIFDLSEIPEEHPMV